MPIEITSKTKIAGKRVHQKAMQRAQGSTWSKIWKYSWFSRRSSYILMVFDLQKAQHLWLTPAFLIPACGWKAVLEWGARSLRAPEIFVIKFGRYGKMDKLSCPLQLFKVVHGLDYKKQEGFQVKEQRSLAQNCHSWKKIRNGFQE